MGFKKKLCYILYLYDYCTLNFKVRVRVSHINIKYNKTKFKGPPIF